MAPYHIVSSDSLSALSRKGQQRNAFQRWQRGTSLSWTFFFCLHIVSQSVFDQNGFVNFALAELLSKSTNTTSRSVSSNDFEAHNGQRQARDRIVMKVLARYPHDNTCFTQGFANIDANTYIESCGLYGKSRVQKVDRESGKILQRTNVSPHYFLEGLAIVGNVVLVLTWKNYRILAFDLKTLSFLKEEPYPFIGWGLAYDEKHEKLYSTDGSNIVHIMRPAWLGNNITSNGVALVHPESNWAASCFSQTATKDLNELEVAEGHLYSNVWHEDYILRINLKTGQCDRNFLLDLTALNDKRGDVLNGILFSPELKKKHFNNGDLQKHHVNLLITGKLWSSIYDIAVS